VAQQIDSLFFPSHSSIPLAQVLTSTHAAVLEDKNVRPTEQEIPQTITQGKIT
jgi:hypothetical protein